MRYINSTSRRMPWPPTGATHYHAQLELPDKGRAIKGSVACYAVWRGSMIYRMGLWISTGCVVWSLVVASKAIELRYRNTFIYISHTYIWLRLVRILRSVCTAQKKLFYSILFVFFIQVFVNFEWCTVYLWI